ncbi:MAG: lipid-binding SYLF domain-containing protein [Acidobacteriaceae bacterium]|jgi:lipid-binding SYLF domain-containing protein|nr:lipid-binding SYLF domain-containing protein [Acidobacteriaceae bacterium]
MKTVLIALLASSVSTAPLVALTAEQTQRIADAATVVTEIHSAPDKDIPQELWAKSACVMVIPSMKKAAFVFGGEYGRGLMSCRHANEWTAPIFMRVDKGSWGLQIGAQSIDLVLLVMNAKGIEKLLGNKVTLGAEMSVAAGPVGRDARAATDAQMTAEILSYSRAQGLFAGINLSGGVVRPDEDANRDLYGTAITPRAVLLDATVVAPRQTQPFLNALRP